MHSHKVRNILFLSFRPAFAKASAGRNLSLIQLKDPSLLVGMTSRAFCETIKI